MCREIFDEVQRYLLHIGVSQSVCACACMCACVCVCMCVCVCVCVCGVFVSLRMCARRLIPITLLT